MCAFLFIASYVPLLIRAVKELYNISADPWCFVRGCVVLTESDCAHSATRWWLVFLTLYILPNSTTRTRNACCESFLHCTKLHRGVLCLYISYYIIFDSALPLRLCRRQRREVAICIFHIVHSPLIYEQSRDRNSKVYFICNMISANLQQGAWNTRAKCRGRCSKIQCCGNGLRNYTGCYIRIPDMNFLQRKGAALNACITMFTLFTTFRAWSRFIYFSRGHRPRRFATGFYVSYAAKCKAQNSPL